MRTSSKSWESTRSWLWANLCTSVKLNVHKEKAQFNTQQKLVMAIQFERRQWEPHRNPDSIIHKFWNHKTTSSNNSQEPVRPIRTKAKTPQPQKKVVSFWETKNTNLVTTSSKSMVSLVRHEVDENRGYTPSDVAKDPAKREFLTNLSKKIFSPPDNKRLSRNNPVSRSFRVRRSSLPSRSFTHSYRH